MLSRIRSRLTYANVVASLSLFLVLSGGTAVALTGSNPVFSDDIVDSQVRAADLGPASVAGSEVKDNSVTGADVFDQGSLDIGVECRYQSGIKGRERILQGAHAGPSPANSFWSCARSLPGRTLALRWAAKVSMRSMQT